MKTKYQYSIQPNEIAGFIALLDCADFYAQERGEKGKWLKQFPELKNTKFEELVDYIRDESQFEKKYPFRKLTQLFLPKIHTVDDFKKYITQFRPKEADKINVMIDSVYPVYQKFYKNNEVKLTDIAQHTTEFLNKIAIEPLKQVWTFFNPVYHPEKKQITVHMFPTVITGQRGTSFHVAREDQSTQEKRFLLQEDQQWIGLGIDILKGRPSHEVGSTCSTIYHEKVHGLFHDSGAYQKLAVWLDSDNKIVKALEDHPELKRNPNVSDKNEAHMMINESLTSAFQGILEEKVRGKIRTVLYENHVINTMAHKVIPLLKDAMETGETFGPEFMKKFEKEFVSSIAEMQKLVHEKQMGTTGLYSTLSDGKQEGKNLTVRQASLAQNQQHT